MIIKVRVNNKDIRYLLEGAGCGYWSRSYRLGKTGLGFSLIETGDGDVEKKHVVTMAMVTKGLTKMANAESNEGGHHFAAVRDPMKSDMYTGDAVVQFAIFGELKYG